MIPADYKPLVELLADLLEQEIRADVLEDSHIPGAGRGGESCPRPAFESSTEVACGTQ